MLPTHVPKTLTEKAYHYGRKFGLLAHAPAQRQRQAPLSLPRRRPRRAERSMRVREGAANVKTTDLPPPPTGARPG